MGFTDVGENNEPVSFQQTFEQKRVEHRQELQRKEEEMRQTFVLRVKEKETELKEVEKEVGYSLEGHLSLVVVLLVTISNLQHCAPPSVSYLNYKCLV